MVLNELHGWMENPSLLNVETLLKLRETIRKYPYFQTARLLYIQNLLLLENPLLEQAVQEAALFLPDRKLLFRLLEGERFQLKPLVACQEESTSSNPQPTNEVEEDDRTSSLIDSFLTVYKEEKQRGAAVPVDLSLDYASVLKEEPNEATASAGEMKGQHLIDSFIAGEEFQLQLSPEENPPLGRSLAFDLGAFRQEESTPTVEPSSAEEEDESCFTETLAKIYVKQGRYEKAIEIIKKLNLKYPEKNSYFADQIRFLEKLIINTKSE